MVKQNLNSDQKPKEKRGTDPRHIALRALCAAHAAAVRGVGPTAKTGTWQHQAADAVTAELAALPETERAAYPQPAKAGRALAKMCKTAFEKLRNRRKKQGDADQGCGDYHRRGRPSKIPEATADQLANLVNAAQPQTQGEMEENADWRRSRDDRAAGME